MLKKSFWHKQNMTFFIRQSLKAILKISTQILFAAENDLFHLNIRKKKQWLQRLKCLFWYFSHDVNVSKVINVTLTEKNKTKPGVNLHAACMCVSYVCLCSNSFCMLIFRQMAAVIIPDNPNEMGGGGFLNFILCANTNMHTVKENKHW